jgi:hypothetical protein
VLTGGEHEFWACWCSGNATGHTTGSRAFCSWTFCSSFLDIILITYMAFCSWILVLEYYTCYLRGVLFLDILFVDSRSWILYLLLAGRFISRSSFLAFLFLAFLFLAFLFLAFLLLAFLLLAFLFLGVVLPGRFVIGSIKRAFCLRGILFLGPRSWRSCSWALRVLGDLGALDSLGNCHPLRGLRLPRLVASCGWVGYFKGVSWGGLCRRGGRRFEDILFKRRAIQGGSAGQWTCFLFVANRGREGSRDDI